MSHGSQVRCLLSVTGSRRDWVLVQIWQVFRNRTVFLAHLLPHATEWHYHSEWFFNRKTAPFWAMVDVGLGRCKDSGTTQLVPVLDFYDTFLKSFECGMVAGSRFQLSSFTTTAECTPYVGEI